MVGTLNPRYSPQSCLIIYNWWYPNSPLFGWEIEHNQVYVIGFLLSLIYIVCWIFYLVCYKPNCWLCRVLLSICILLTLWILSALLSRSFYSSSQLLPPLLSVFSPFISSNLSCPTSLYFNDVPVIHVCWNFSLASVKLVWKGWG